MTVNLTPQAYRKLVEDDIKWLLGNAPSALERSHIIEVLQDHVRGVEKEAQRKAEVERLSNIT